MDSNPPHHPATLNLESVPDRFRRTRRERPVASRYLLYARKSQDREDRQIQSLPDQVRLGREAAMRQGLLVVEEIVEAASAKRKGQRPGFARMVDLIETGKADGVLTWAPDRLARNAVDGGTVIDLLDQGVLRNLVFASGYQFDNTPEGKYMLATFFGQSKYFVDKLTSDVSRGMDSKRDRGGWPHRAPEGYLNSRDERGNKIVVPDPLRFPLLRRAVESILAGERLPSEVLDLLNGVWGYTTRPTKKREAGKPLPNGGFYRILANPFYCGLCRFEDTLYPGVHEPLMTGAEFAQVQAFLKRTGTGRPAPEVERETVPFVRPPARQRRHDLAFVGLMRCGKCGVGMVSATISKGRVYYHCSNRKGICDKHGVREEEITKQLGAFVAAVSFPPQLEPQLQQALDRQIAEQYDAAQRKQVEQEKKQRLTAAQGRLARLRGLVADGVLEPDEYRAEKEKTTREILLLDAPPGENESERVRIAAWRAAHTAVTVAARFASQSSSEKRAAIHEIAAARVGESAWGPKLVLTGGKVLLEPSSHLLPFMAWNQRKRRFKPLESGSGTQKEPTRAGSVPFGGPADTLCDLAKEIIRSVAAEQPEGQDRQAGERGPGRSR